MSGPDRRAAVIISVVILVFGVVVFGSGESGDSGARPEGNRSAAAQARAEQATAESLAVANQYQLFRDEIRQGIREMIDEGSFADAQAEIQNYGVASAGDLDDLLALLRERNPRMRERPSLGQWRVSSSADQMTGERSVYASSRRVSPTASMGFPYNDAEAWLGFGCNGRSEWAYVGFSDQPNLIGTDTESGYDTFITRVKWDNNVRNTGFLQTWGESFIHFRNDGRAIANMIASSTVRVELSWYGEGQVYFDFSLDGSSAAIGQARGSCRG